LKNESNAVPDAAACLEQILHLRPLRRLPNPLNSGGNEQRD
jgi:hypothetical protein